MLQKGEVEVLVQREYNVEARCTIQLSISPHWKGVPPFLYCGVLFFLFHLFHQPDLTHCTANTSQAGGLFLGIPTGNALNPTVFALHLPVLQPHCFKHGYRRPLWKQRDPCNPQ